MSKIESSYFIINFGQTSSTVQDLLFNKYSIHLDYPFNRKPIFNPKAFYCLRPFYKNKKKMEFKDFFNNDLFINHDFKILKDISAIILYFNDIYFSDTINSIKNHIKKTPIIFFKRNNLDYIKVDKIIKNL